MATIHLLSVDSMLCQRITDALGGRITVEMVQTLEDIDKAMPGVIVVDHAAVPTERSLTSIIASVAEHAHGRAIVLATDDISARQVLQAIRAGATDVVARNAEGDDVSSILLRVLNKAIVAQGRLGRVTLVLGADEEAAAIAATDIALAHALNQTQTLLVDCTLPSSTAEAYLDLKVDYGIASAVADIDRMDASLLADALARHEPSGLSLLTLDGGTGSEPVGLAANDIVGLIHLLQASCDHIVLCAGSLRHGGLLRELASQAQVIEVVCSQSIRELDACRRLLDRVAIDTASAYRMRLLVWDYDPRILLDGRRMADVLGIDALMGIPTDRVLARNALNAGQPLAMQKDDAGYLKAIHRACNISTAPKGARPGLDRLRRAIMRSVERTA